MYQIKAHQVKVPKQKQLKSVLHLGVGIKREVEETQCLCGFAAIREVF